VPDVLTLKTPHFDLSVWTKEIGSAQALLVRTHAARNAALPANPLRFNPALPIDEVVLPADVALPVQPVTELVLPVPMFFENKQYEFEFLFRDMANQTGVPSVVHRLNSIEEGFHYKRGSLRGSINFGNDIGWFRLGVRYTESGREVIRYISFEVLPTKMAMATDLETIHRDIDTYYPLWRFSFVQKTEQELAKSRKPHERFALLWLAHFEKLRGDLEKGVRRICNAPHTRLLPHERHVRAERLRGRLPPKLEEGIGGHLGGGETQHRYRVTAKRLSPDTPENRFVKMVLVRCGQDIARFAARARENNLSPDRERLSESFFEELERWKKPLDQLLNRPFFDEVGAFGGMASESLVLHQRAGYAAVYRIWQELKLYLDLFGRNGSVSMKSVAELYEVWCLLEVRRMLLELGFAEKSAAKAALGVRGFEKSLAGGMGAAFVLERGDGITIRLAHEPVFSRVKDPSFGKIYSWTTVQKPDIFLEATFANGESIQWIFDAKYRIAEHGNGTDHAPDDAINQMHRYRDALIHVNKADDGGQEKTRPILGAFVLYPGWFDEESSNNPYDEAIGEVCIGGFPLLPGRPNKWLRDFLESRFGNANMAYKIPEPDQYLAEDSARIATMGTYLGRYSDLTLAAPLGPARGRDKQYLKWFENGEAGWYHIKLNATDKKSIARNVMREIRYCAVGVHHSESGERAITYLYEVKSVRLVKRCDISFEQSGKLDTGNEEEYWLFELGYARPLSNPVKMPVRAFKFQLTGAAELLSAANWDALPMRYTLLT
jgi:hypothetical protein